jgi:hypothetical protein
MVHLLGEEGAILTANRNTAEQFGGVQQGRGMEPVF